MSGVLQLHAPGLYPRLLDHAVVCFRAQDLMTFLGRKFHPLYEGEVLTSLQVRGLIAKIPARIAGEFQPRARVC